MKKFFYGAGRRGPYFEGWYVKHQPQSGPSLALIPALHVDGKGAKSASLQILTPDQAWTIDYSGDMLQASEGVFQVWLGGNLFNSKGMWLNLQTEGLEIHGALHYGPFTPLKSDIMGPFRFVPGMQCSHGVLSMGHRLEGALLLNGQTLDFTGGVGYVETDRGRSFPSAYLWTQCAWREGRSNSLMVSVANIPISAGHFNGCICAVLYAGREYRLATYHGAKLEAWGPNGAVLHQGPYRLEVELLDAQAQPLQAPVEGCMSRTIRESLCAIVRYRFWKGNTLLFDHADSHASYEFAASPETVFPEKG